MIISIEHQQPIFTARHLVTLFNLLNNPTRHMLLIPRVLHMRKWSVTWVTLLDIPVYQVLPWSQASLKPPPPSGRAHPPRLRPPPRGGAGHTRHRSLSEVPGPRARRRLLPPRQPLPARLPRFWRRGSCAPLQSRVGASQLSPTHSASSAAPTRAAPAQSAACRPARFRTGSAVTPEPLEAEAKGYCTGADGAADLQGP